MGAKAAVVGILSVCALALGGCGTESDGTWQQLELAGKSPSAREGAAMVYVPELDRVILFGGSMTNDTWAYDPRASTWTELEPGGSLPAAREYHAMAYDPMTKKIILFAGRGYAADGALERTEVSFGDTWAYDPTANTWTNLSLDDTGPGRRESASLVRDPATGRMILFSGTLWSESPESVHHTWAYDPVRSLWIDVEPGEDELPTARLGSALVCDPSSNTLIMFGGMDAFGELDDTWSFDPAEKRWGRLGDGAECPTPRQRHSMAFEPGSGDAILFGGRSSGERYGDTWAYDPAGGDWRKLHPAGGHPAARTGAAMVYVPTIGALVLFGGSGGPGSPEYKVYGDTWVYRSAVE